MYREMKLYNIETYERTLEKQEGSEVK